MHINPDHFLDVDGVRVIDADRNAAAWQQCFAVLPRALAQLPPGGRLYVMVGPQGAGKTTRAAALLSREPRSVIFDAILVKKSERAPIVTEAKRAGSRRWRSGPDFPGQLPRPKRSTAARPGGPAAEHPQRVRGNRAADCADGGFSEIVLVQESGS